MLSHFSHVWLFETLWTVAHQAPLFMGFSGQEYWSGFTCPSSRGSSQPWDWTHVLCLQHWHVSSLPLAPPHCQRASAITLQPRRVHSKSCRGSLSADVGPRVHVTHWVCHCCLSQVTRFKSWAKLPLSDISPETFILSVYSWNKYLGSSVILSY